MSHSTADCPIHRSLFLSFLSQLFPSLTSLSTLVGSTDDTKPTLSVLHF